MSNTKIDNETPCRRGDERVNLPEVAWAWVVAVVGVVGAERIFTRRAVSWFEGLGVDCGDESKIPFAATEKRRTPSEIVDKLADPLLDKLPANQI